MKSKLAIFVACLILIAHAAPSPNTATESLRFTYDFPGNPGVTNFILSYGTASGVYPSQVYSGLSTNVTVTGLTRNTVYYFVASAQDTNGIESDYSPEATYTTPRKPSNPTSLTPL